ncbi:MAG: deoxyribose-phosphate aldolase [Planctomycetota bacterium]
MKPKNEEELASVIDHTILIPTVTGEHIRRHCEEAIKYRFFSVCVNPRWVPLAEEVLRNSGVKVVGVAGFPLGADSTAIKVAQTRELIFAGADEIDMVADLAAIIEGDRQYLSDQLEQVCSLCHSMRPKVVLKVIIEAAALQREQKEFACDVCSSVGVDFVKTSTGLHPAGGASVEDIRLMKTAARQCRIKAAGGIRTAKQALDMLEAGADRIGCSASVQIIEQFRMERMA